MGYSAGLCSNCLSNNLFTSESITAALQKEAQGSLSSLEHLLVSTLGGGETTPFSTIHCDNHVLKQVLKDWEETEPFCNLLQLLSQLCFFL